MKKWQKRCRLSLVILAALSLFGCVHEYPELGGDADVALRLTYSQPMPIIAYPVPEQQSRATNDFLARYESGTIRYIIEVYRKGDQAVAMKKISFTRNLLDGYNCERVLQLPAGEYDVRVWTDLQAPNGNYFYNADQFTGIYLEGNQHYGNTDYRDAFCGQLDLTVVVDGVERPMQEEEVVMERPVARYEFISTDLKTFIAKELKRHTLVAESNTAENLESEAEEAEATTVNLSDYMVTFYYVGFMPNEYNMFAERPADSKTGVAFAADIREINSEEASIGFDYVLVNHKETQVTVRLGLTDKYGVEVALTDPIDVPLLRNHDTEVRGKFLTAKSNSGINIETDFDGDHNIIFKQLWKAKYGCEWHDRPQSNR